MDRSKLLKNGTTVKIVNTGNKLDGNTGRIVGISVLGFVTTYIVDFGSPIEDYPCWVIPEVCLIVV